jgi:hypothetical protein
MNFINVAMVRYLRLRVAVRGLGLRSIQDILEINTHKIIMLFSVNQSTLIIVQLP